MKVYITPKKLKGRVKAPGDKSEIIRYIIISALKESECTIRNINLCDDVLSCMDCVENMQGIMDAGECATVLRLMLPGVVRKYGKADFKCAPSLIARPMTPYENIFRVFEKKNGMIHAEGFLEKDCYELPLNISSQFFSGLAIAGCNVKGVPESSRYFEMTKRILAEHFPADVTVGEDPTLKELWNVGNIKIGDASEEPDLVPLWALQASLKPGKTVIGNARRLRYKESDRLFSVCEVLKKLGADIKIEEDSLVINGVERLKGGCDIDPFNDHRIAMMAAIAAQWCEEGINLHNAECVSKSYPSFYDDYEKLGGIIEYS